MNANAKFKWLIAILFIAVNTMPLFAQNKADVFNDQIPVTWLGLDFSQTKFIGTAAQYKEAGQVTNAEFKDKYTVGWNQLFINEQKKYDVAGAVHRSSVKYAIDVTQAANAALTKDFFSENPGDYKVITESNISELVKKYDFKNNEGIGFMFFVEGMSKAKDEAGAWATFVDMKSKTVLFTAYVTGKTGGFGFRNYYAKTFNNMLKEVGSNFKNWKK